MKFSIQQLNKIYQFPYVVEYDYDFSSFIKGSSDSLDTDIIEVKKAHAQISIFKDGIDTFRFHYIVDAELVLPCSLTLEPVDYPMHLDFSETYTNDQELLDSDEDYDYFPFDGNTVNTIDAVWSNIVVNIPIRVVRDDAYEILKSRNIVLDDIPMEDEK